jgi:hypothetical protein
LWYGTLIGFTLNYNSKSNTYINNFNTLTTETSINHYILYENNKVHEFYVDNISTYLKKLLSTKEYNYCSFQLDNHIFFEIQL